MEEGRVSYEQSLLNVVRWFGHYGGDRRLGYE